jgi:acyl carrier protein
VSQPLESTDDSATLDFADLQRLAAEILGVNPEKVQMDVSFARDLAADSLDLVELIMAVEDHYHVPLPEQELERMKKVGDLWAYLGRHAKSPAGPG